MKVPQKRQRGGLFSEWFPMNQAIWYPHSMQSPPTWGLVFWHVACFSQLDIRKCEASEGWEALESWVFLLKTAAIM